MARLRAARLDPGKHRTTSDTPPGADPRILVACWHMCVPFLHEPTRGGGTHRRGIAAHGARQGDSSLVRGDSGGARRADGGLTLCAGDCGVRPHQDVGDVRAIVIEDLWPGQGPLVAMGQGLRAAAERGAGRAFVCAVDMPLVAPALIDELAAGGDRIVLATAGGRDHYLAAVYDVGLCETIDELTTAGERRLGTLVERVGAQRISISEPKWIVNVNTAADLAALPPLP